MKPSPLILLGHRLLRGSSVLLPVASPVGFTGDHLRSLHFPTERMVELKDPENVIDGMRSRVREQGNVVRALKSSNASAAELNVALAELRARKKVLEEKEMELSPPAPSFDRGKLEDLLKQRFFYDQAFSIYGGVQGLYDYGPMGCAMKANLLSAWRQHFVIEDQLLEVDCSMLTPAPVLQASGHVERFTDLMVKDIKTGDCFRADHLVKSGLETKLKDKKTVESEKEAICKVLLQLDNLTADELEAVIQKYDLRSPTTNNALSKPQEFNLMFSTTIGPSGQCKGYLRPETAQGIFVNFQRLLQFNQGRIPFGAAQIGPAFRNEISPRSGLIRVREFVMAEIEYFVDPRNKHHPKFSQVKDTVLTLYCACAQMDGLSPRAMTIGKAVEEGIVANETLGYFMARIHSFLLLIGVDAGRLRFRQHLSNEMAHYACDCWDAECQTSYGWIECVGCADRSCFDLTQHAKATGARLVAEKRLPEPLLVQVCKCVPNKQALGRAFRGEAKSVIEHMTLLGADDTLSLKQKLLSAGQAELLIDGKQFVVDASMVEIKEFEDKVHVEEITPNVIEPSFGIGRILYVLFEHCFRIRDGDEQRTYLSVPSILAPYKCSVLPLSPHPSFSPFVTQLSNALTRLGVSHRVDDSSGSIGRRYARTDQIAIPYGITVDFDTVNKSPASATLRERDTMAQIRVPLEELPPLVSDLSNGLLTWSDAQAKYPLFEQQDTAPRELNFPQVPEVNCGTTLEPKTVEKPLLLAPPWLSSMRQTQTSQSKTDVTGKVMTDEEWQGFSNKLTNMGRCLEPDTDDWSSATETAEANPPSMTQYTDQKGEGPDSPTGMKPTEIPAKLAESGSDHYEEPLKTFDSIDPVIKTEKSDSATISNSREELISKPVHKRPISWTDWGKAIRRFYQEEELKEKNMQPKSLFDLGPAVSVSHSLEPDETPSSFSGYEADQEDNVTSKSTSDLFSFPTKHHVTPMVETKPTELNSVDGSSPVSKGNIPHHGLFAGHGWPDKASKQHKKCGSEAVSVTPEPNLVHLRKPSGTDKPISSAVSYSASTTDRAWQYVMAQLLDKSNEPEMWQLQLDPVAASLTGLSECRASQQPQSIPGKHRDNKDQDTDAFDSLEVHTAEHELFREVDRPKHSKDRIVDTSSHVAAEEQSYTSDLLTPSHAVNRIADSGSHQANSVLEPVELSNSPLETDDRNLDSSQPPSCPKGFSFENIPQSDEPALSQPNLDLYSTLIQTPDALHLPDAAGPDVNDEERTGGPDNKSDFLGNGLGDDSLLTDLPKTVDPWVNFLERAGHDFADAHIHDEPASITADTHLNTHSSMHAPELSSDSFGFLQQLPENAALFPSNRFSSPDHIAQSSEVVSKQPHNDSFANEHQLLNAGSNEEKSTGVTNKPNIPKNKRRRNKKKKK